MKFNKWTLGLAAVGVVSLASVARADEKVSQLNTALSNTTISGYVDVGAQYINAAGGAYSIAGIPGAAFATATGAPYSTAGSAGADSTSLNVVDIALDKPLDATPYSAGYHIELWTGPGNTIVTGNSLVRQAYLALATGPVDWKIGVWDTIIGYEGLTSSGNPNYTHSYGFAVEPTTHTGIQGTYQINSSVSVEAAVADDSYAGGATAYNAAVNGATALPLHHPTILGAVTLTAPDSFGPLKGATLTAGGIYTPGGTSGGDTEGFGESLYVGTTIPTPIAALKFGGAFDYFEAGGTGQTSVGHIWVAGLYGTYQATDKLSFNVRGETFDQTAGFIETVTVVGGPNAGTYFTAHGEELTATAQYALWANVVSRLEARLDHADDGPVFANTANGRGERNAVFLGAQLIYSF
jgi:hypothetical protein